MEKTQSSERQKKSSMLERLSDVFMRTARIAYIPGSFIKTQSDDIKEAKEKGKEYGFFKKAVGYTSMGVLEAARLGAYGIGAYAMLKGDF